MNHDTRLGDPRIMRKGPRTLEFQAHAIKVNGRWRFGYNVHARHAALEAPDIACVCACRRPRRW